MKNAAKGYKALRAGEAPVSKYGTKRTRERILLVERQPRHGEGFSKWNCPDCGRGLSNGRCFVCDGCR